MSRPFRNGERARTVVPIILPHAVVAPGITGCIVDVDPDIPTEVTFRPDNPSPDLADWNDMVPADAEQLVAISKPLNLKRFGTTAALATLAICVVFGGLCSNGPGRGHAAAQNVCLPRIP
jgi:hypothetical protein